MPTYISMLRGINVGGQKKIKMADLRKFYQSLGYKAVQSYIQSGNVVFQVSEKDTTNLEKTIVTAIRDKYGFDVTVIVRTPQEFNTIVKNNPFSNKDTGRIYVTFLSEIPTDFPRDRLSSAQNGQEEFQLSEQEIYLFMPDGYGRTKLSNNFFERVLGVGATTRNWRTVNRLLEMAKS